MNGIGRAELGAELGQGSDGMESGKNRADDSRSRTRGVGQTKSRPSIRRGGHRTSATEAESQHNNSVVAVSLK